MQFFRTYKWAIVAAGAVVVLVGFLAFRPDKLFIDDQVDESLSEAFATTTTTSVAQQQTEQATPDTVPGNGSAVPDSQTTTTATASAPTGVVSGAFYGVGHSAEGRTTVYEQDGSYVLRLEDDTDIQNGPDLYVYLLATDDFDGTLPSDVIDLGKLKGNVGGQNYELPPDFDPDVYKTVLIWCLRFRIAFAASPMA